MGTADEANILQIPRDFAAKEGVKLTEGLFIGGHISSGLQVVVFDRSQGKNLLALQQVWVLTCCLPCHAGWRL